MPLPRSSITLSTPHPQLQHLLHPTLLFSLMHATLSHLTRFSSLSSFLLYQPLSLKLFLLHKAPVLSTLPKPHFLLLKSLHLLLLPKALSPCHLLKAPPLLLLHLHLPL